MQWRPFPDARWICGLSADRSVIWLVEEFRSVVVCVSSNRDNGLVDCKTYNIVILLLNA